MTMSHQDFKRELLDDDGENRAVRAFLMYYGGGDDVTAEKMATHMRMSGFDVVPDWIERSPGHLTKGGAQLWLRMLFDLEKPECDLGDAIGVEVVGIVKPAPTFDRGEEGPTVEWTLEGGLDAVAEGGEALLLVAHRPITDDDGHGWVRKAEESRTPVMWQYRWTNPKNDPDVTEAELEWMPVVPNRLQTLEQRLAEIRGFNWNDVPTYEVRALYP